MTVSQELRSSGHQGSGKSVEGHQHVWAPARSCTIWTLCGEVVAAVCKERLQGYMHAVWDEGLLGPFWRPAQKPLVHGDEPLLLQLGSRPNCNRVIEGPQVCMRVNCMRSKRMHCIDIYLLLIVTA